MRKINIGLIGAGRIGKLHAENLVKRVDGASLVCIAEKPERFKEAVDYSTKLGVYNATGDYHKILTNPDIAAVVICSSTDTHAQMIIEAAQAGKHIFCEKPIDFDLKKINEALKAVKKAGVKLQIGFNRRFDHDFEMIRQRIVLKEIGKLRKVKIISRDPNPPPIDYIKVSGGLFMDMAIHDFDMARFLTDSEPDEIFARGWVMVDPKIGQAGDIDTAETIIKFKNGVIATIDNCRQSAIGYDQRIEAFGSDGIAFNKNRRENNTFLADESGQYSSQYLDFFLRRYKQSYITEMVMFVDAILYNRPVSVSGQDGKIAAMMAMAAKKSFKEKRWIKFNEIAGGKK